LALLLLDPSGKPWIQRRPQDYEEEQRRTKSYEQPDQNRGFQQQPRPQSQTPSNSTLGVRIREIEARNRDIARTIPMTATTSPIAAPISAEAAISPIVSAASSQSTTRRPPSLR
jgi:hypothetical protein